METNRALGIRPQQLHGMGAGLARSPHPAAAARAAQGRPRQRLGALPSLLHARWGSAILLRTMVCKCVPLLGACTRD